MIIAAFQGHAEIVQLLLSQPDIKIDCEDILIQNIHDIHNSFFHNIQIYNHFWNLIRIFNWTPLFYAAFHGHTKIVQLLLKTQNIDINHRSVLI